MQQSLEFPGHRGAGEQPAAAIAAPAPAPESAPLAAAPRPPLVLPRAHLPTAPGSAVLWGRVGLVAWAVLGLFLLDQLTGLLADLWLLESLGFPAIFWTNFSTGAALFAVGTLVYAAAVIVPALIHGL